MRTGTRSKIIDIIGKNGEVGVARLSYSLKISPQAVHRHLSRLQKEGRICKVGSPPQSKYRLSVPALPASEIPDREQVRSQVTALFGSHPAVRLICLFGSVATGRANSKSDIDLMVWLKPTEAFDRRDIWNYWDRHTRTLPWASRVSLIVRRATIALTIDTLLLDLPEEHAFLAGDRRYFDSVRESVIEWRSRNQAVKVLSFNGTHYWKYSSDPKKQLSQIDFNLELKNVS